MGITCYLKINRNSSGFYSTHHMPLIPAELQEVLFPGPRLLSERKSGLFVTFLSRV